MKQVWIAVALVVLLALMQLMEAGEHGLHGRNVTQNVLKQMEKKCEHESVIIQYQKREERLASEMKKRKKIAK